MKQEAFEKLNSPTWDRFEKSLQALSEGKVLESVQPGIQENIGQHFPRMYRQICHHLSLARARRYSAALQQRLNQLALAGHQHLYRSRWPLRSALFRLIARDFPRTSRIFWRYILVSALVFYLPAFAMALAVHFQPELVYSLLEPLQVSRMEEMYDPANSVLGRERESDTDVFMFGFYIYNNISIGFQIFAGGLLFGLGSVFYLLFNGLFFGAIASHLTSAGYANTFFQFVIGHSSFELTAIVIFGGAGLMLGHGAIAPGSRTRWQAVRQRAINGLPLVYGSTLMLVAAAFVEAFWSSTTWSSDGVKYSVGTFLWVCQVLYFGWMGRNEP